MAHQGTILVAPGTLLPECLQLEESAPNVGSWHLLKPAHDPQKLERQLRAAG
ncbi:MAG: hypothetical protein IPJ98_26380 [Bryobacterales bacterium]|nr:hypothetical protein [Bryobacterales bacterium]